MRYVSVCLHSMFHKYRSFRFRNICLVAYYTPTQHAITSYYSLSGYTKTKREQLITGAVHNMQIQAFYLLCIMFPISFLTYFILTWKYSFWLSSAKKYENSLQIIIYNIQMECKEVWIKQQKNMKKYLIKHLGVTLSLY